MSSLRSGPWPLLAIVVGWLIAAVVLFAAGMWVSETNRYDGCTYVVDLAPQPFFACPYGDPRPVERLSPEL